MSKGQWRIEVDQSTCIASGMCVGLAPEHFDLTDDGSTPLSEVVDPADVVIDAAESCPVEAIKIRDAADGTLIAPTDV